jgi:SAM-dependent methyltransferase
MISKGHPNWNLERPSFPQADSVARYIFARSYVSKKLVLDAGCGAGHGLHLLSKDSRSLVGVDASVLALDYARRHRTANDGIELLAQDVRSLGFRNESFDVIVSFEVVEHLKNYRAYLREIRRVLKYGGVFIVSTPDKRVMSPGRRDPVWKWHYIEFYCDEFKSLLGEFFENVRMFGETVRNPHWLARDRKAILLHRHTKTIPTALLRLVPMRLIRLLLWNVPSPRLDEIEISESCLKTARTLIAVCEKQRADR